MTTAVHSENVVDMSFVDFLKYWMRTWEQGDHVSMIGHTKCGKTTLAKYLLRRRDYVTMFNCKGRDSSATKYMEEEGFVKQTKGWDGSDHDRILLWPGGKTQQEAVANQYHIFHHAIDDMYQQGGWCIYLDEVSYLSDFLNMDRHLRWLLQQGRSSNISVMAATQRPAFIPLAFYDQPEHLFFWRENDDVNLKRIRGIGGQDGKQIQETVKRLRHREVLYVHTRHPGERFRFTVNLKGTSS